MKGMTILLVLGGLLAASSASAGTVFRCEGGDGLSYSSRRLPGAKCSIVSQYTPPARAGRSQAQEPAVSTPAVGAVAPANAVAGSPAAVSVPAAASAPGSAPRLVKGQIYSYLKDGVRHYTSRRPQGVAHAGAVRTIQYSYMETCFACAKRPGVNFKSIRLRPEAYNAEITRAAAQYGVDDAIVRAIIHAESSFNPNAISRVGAQGLMQLMPATARRFGVTNAFDPAQNIRGGVQYLAWLLKRFKGDLTLAAAGYNAGEGAVDKYRGVPPYSETQRYVQRVGLLADRYRGAPILR